MLGNRELLLRLFQHYDDVLGDEGIDDVGVGLILFGGGEADHISD